MYRMQRFLLFKFCDLKVKANLKKKISAGKAWIFAFVSAQNAPLIQKAENNNKLSI